MRSSTAVMALSLLGIVAGCAAAPVAKPTAVEAPIGLPTPPPPPEAPACAWSFEEEAAWQAAWREYKQAQVDHPAGWALRQEEIFAAVAVGPREVDQRALERLYTNRMGTPVFVINGQLGAHAEEVRGVIQHPDLQDDPIVQATAALAERWGELEDGLGAAVSQPLEEADLRRLCGGEFAVERLTRPRLEEVGALEVQVGEARRVGAQLDAALVVATWHLTDKVQKAVASLPKLERPRALDAAKHQPLDAELLSRAVWATLRYDSDRRPFEEVGPLIRRAVVAAQLGDIDPFVLVTLIFMESRFRPEAIGDGGLACGMAQQHAEYSMFWPEVSDAGQRFMEVRIPEERTRRQRRYECDRLKEPDYALKVLVYNLNIIKSRAPDLTQSVCRYNEGPYAPCKGRGLHYLKAHTWWRETIRLTYHRLQEQLQQPEAAQEQDQALSDNR